MSFYVKRVYGQKFVRKDNKANQGNIHRQENRRLVGNFYDMKNRFWAVVWADYEQLLREFFSMGKKRKRNNLKTL